MFNTVARSFDWILVGGGLQSGLAALAIRAAQPSASIAIVERAAHLGGEHLWSFHQGDVPAEARAWVEPLVVRRWPRWRASFPGLDRTFDTTYASISSRRLHEVVTASLASHPPSALFLGRAARWASAREVGLDDGQVLHGRAVVDARGPERVEHDGAVGFQKFVGLELELERPLDDAEASAATVFDATVGQSDGLRFFYRLPLAPDRVLVEETFYADEPSLDVAGLRRSILAHAAARGLAVRGVVREERGALPLPLERAVVDVGDHEAPIRAGFAAGFFHPTTGYSLPLAVRAAAIFAASTPEHARPALAAEASRVERRARFYVALNRLLFRAIAPDARRNVLERFHTLPEETVLRFYALASTPADRARIVCGRPPRGMSIGRAIAALFSPRADALAARSS